MSVVKVSPLYDGKPFGVHEVWYGGEVVYKVVDNDTGATVSKTKVRHNAHRTAQTFNARYS